MVEGYQTTYTKSTIFLVLKKEIITKSHAVDKYSQLQSSSIFLLSG